MKPSRSFASDNNAGVHPEILKSIAEINSGHVVAYGEDPFTEAAVQQFKKHFGDSAEPYFVFNGTAANVLALKSLTRSYNSVLCAETSHIYEDECGAPEMFTGCKLVPLPTEEGKLTVETIRKKIHGVGDQHHVQPKVVSIAQATEAGTVYSVAEVKALADFAHAHGMYLHMDGARLANAAAGLGVRLRDITVDAGVDVLSFGGTKNGLLCGEAVVFFNKKLSEKFKYVRKQGMQLASKMRFLSVQFSTILANDLWLKNALHANEMARILAREIDKMPILKVSRKVEANAVFVILPRPFIAPLQEKYFFYVWNEHTPEVRWMTAFDTTESDIKEFVRAIREIVK